MYCLRRRHLLLAYYQRFLGDLIVANSSDVEFRCGAGYEKNPGLIERTQQLLLVFSATFFVMHFIGTCITVVLTSSCHIVQEHLISVHPEKFAWIPLPGMESPKKEENTSRAGLKVHNPHILEILECFPNPRDVSCF
jgi:hypothetical protein